MAYVTGAEVLTFVGASAPSADEEAWADACAAAVESAITERLGGAVIADPSGALDELKVAARIAAAEAYKRKEAIFGVTGFADLQGNAVRVARDYMDGVRPIVDRYRIYTGIG
jgi:hypothetical protein